MNRNSAQRKLVTLALSTALVACMATSAAVSQSVGVVVDRGRPASSPLGGRVPYVHVFDPGTMKITGSVALPTTPFTSVFDVEIAPDLTECYVGDNDTDQLWTIDLTASPPQLAAGPNPLQLSGGCLDLALSPDGRFLVCGTGSGVGSGGTTLSVVDVRQRKEVSTLPFTAGLGTSPTAVGFSPDGTLLIGELTASTASSAESTLRRFRLDSQGQLADTGQSVSSPAITGVQDLLVPSYPQLPRFVNLFLAQHTVYVSRPAGGVLGGVRTDGLQPVSAVQLDYPTGIDLTFDHLRSIVYARTNEQGTSGPAGAGNARIDGYFFSPFTGRFGPKLVSIDLDRRAGTAFGLEQTAIDPHRRRLFVSGLAGGEVRVFNSLTGAQVGTITDPDFLFGLGVAVRWRQ